MALIYIVRHGKAAASFAEDLDPGLDDTGRRQAQVACRQLALHMPLALVSSPLKRARETATPLLEKSGADIVTEARVSEIPSPGLSVKERGPWLREVMQGRWSAQADELKSWRQDLVDYLANIDTDTAIFSHFVAINAAVGAATDDDSILIFRPDNGSITVLEAEDGTLTLVAMGQAAETRVN